MSALFRLLAIALAMTGVLAFMVVQQANARSGGTEIRLDMEPVDPRDLLLGHYVELTTPLQRLETGELENGELHAFQQGGRIWVGLAEGENGSSRPVSVHGAPPPGRHIQGRIRRASTIAGEPGQHLTVSYNIERYFASPEAALELEGYRDERRLRLIVSLDASGAAVIKGLEIDGEDHLDTLF